MNSVRTVCTSAMLVCAAMGATASAATAADYTAKVSPGSVAPGSSTTYTVTLANISGRKPPLNAALVQPPQGFTLTAVSRPSGSGNAALRGGQVVLKGLSLHGGQSERVAITATTPQICKQLPWSVQAFTSSLHGRPLVLDSAHSSLTTTVTCASTVTEPCPASRACSPATLNTSDSIVEVTTGTGADAGTLTLSLDPGARLTCPGYEEPSDAHWYGVVESTGERSKTFRETLFNASTHGLEVCFAAPYEFELPNGDNAPPGTLPDGSQGFVGLLERCESEPEPPEACVQTIVPSGRNAIITVKIDGGLPGDPWIGP